MQEETKYPEAQGLGLGNPDLQEEKKDWKQLAVLYFQMAVLWTKQYSILLIFMLMAVALLTHSMFITSLVAMCYVYVLLYLECHVFIFYCLYAVQDEVSEKEPWIRTCFFFQGLQFTCSPYKNDWEAYLQFVCDTLSEIKKTLDMDKMDSDWCYYMYYVHYLGWKLFQHLAYNFMSPYCVLLPMSLFFMYILYGLIHLCMQVWNYLFRLCSMVVVWFSVVIILMCICYALWDMYHKKFMSLHSALLFTVAILAFWSNFKYSLGQEQVEKYIDDISHEFHTCNGKVIHYTPKAKTFPLHDTCTAKEMYHRYYAYWDKEQPDHFYTNDLLVFEDMRMLFSSGYLAYPDGLRLPPRILNDPISMASNDPNPALPLQCVENKPDKPLFTERLETHECAAAGALDARNRTIPQRLPSLWSWLLQPVTTKYMIEEFFDDLLDAQYTMQEWNWTDFASWDDNNTEMVQHWTNLALYMDATMDSIRVPVSNEWVNLMHTYLCSYDKCMPQLTHAVFDVAEKNVANYTAGFSSKAMREATKAAG